MKKALYDAFPQITTTTTTTTTYQTFQPSTSASHPTPNRTQPSSYAQPLFHLK